VGGEAGAAAVLNQLTAELQRAMALCGASTVGALSRDLVWRDASRGVDGVA